MSQVDFKLPLGSTHIEVNVSGYYFKGFPGDRETPREPERFEIKTIRLMGEDITEFLTMDVFEDLEASALQHLHEMRDIFL